ncbi:MAG: hypothetical protein Ct9H300mP21_09000 [Pseudomonadota bacterium]|nr:MAG: hypothetical protein Ct9H300mP21_09000 [Pseudomonadota bacterium]
MGKNSGKGSPHLLGKFGGFCKKSLQKDFCASTVPVTDLGGFMQNKSTIAFFKTLENFKCLVLGKDLIILGVLSK